MLRLFDHSLVQQRPPQAKALSKWKFSVDFKTFVDKANPIKCKSLVRIDRHTESAKNGKRIRHQAFTAGLVDGRPSAVGYYDVEPSLARRDRSGKPGWTSTDDKHVRCLSHSAPQLLSFLRNTRI
jgi:hypothetical protein